MDLEVFQLNGKNALVTGSNKASAQPSLLLWQSLAQTLAATGGIRNRPLHARKFAQPAVRRSTPPEIWRIPRYVLA
jgi:hypothetical protein